ncbi:uncharacterized protein si:dkey-182g1.6 [Pimephales promelas]|uniref:uncharacterized protein si:dkey-182g1.6 n=1 Tax=Pimephales promelas TaxID=90988 RepID=UPI0019558AB7|nr:uncharacterized protein si:dkey-182g1.6 [Pimephales promelas]
MRNHSSLFLVVLALLMDGVSVAVTDDVKPVSVMKGDSVILNTGVSELQSDDTIEWIFGDKLIIAKIEGKNKISINAFRDRLELDSENGSLTIKDITNEQEGLYKVDIRGRYETSKRFNVTVRDVVESVSVLEGDTVTLHTGVTKKQRDDQILWKFKDQVINTDRLNGPDARWSNIDLNDQTGEITIRNIRRDQTGDYKVEINTSSMILHRKRFITVDEVKTVSVNEGDSIILRTGVINIQECDQILWKFVDHLIAKINKGENQFSLFSADGRFEGRLHPDYQSGSLTISNSNITDSGDYHLKMSNSTYTIQRNISVSVRPDPRSPDPGPHTNYILVCGLVFGIGFLVASATAVAIFCYKERKKERAGFDAVQNPGSG